MTHPHQSILDSNPNHFVRDYDNLGGSTPAVPFAQEISWVAVEDANGVTHWQQITVDENTGAQVITYYDMPGGAVTAPVAPITPLVGEGAAQYRLISALVSTLNAGNIFSWVGAPANACGAEVHIIEGDGVNVLFDGNAPTAGTGGGIYENRHFSIGCTPQNSGTLEEAQAVQITPFSGDVKVHVLFYEVS